MERVIEALEFIVDQKESALFEAEAELKSLGEEKRLLMTRIDVLKASNSSMSSVINQLVKDGKCEADSLISVHRISRKHANDDLMIALENLKSVNDLISTTGELVSDLYLDIDEIKSFLVNHRQIRKGVVRKLVAR